MEIKKNECLNFGQVVCSERGNKQSMKKPSGHNIQNFIIKTVYTIFQSSTSKTFFFWRIKLHVHVPHFSRYNASGNKSLTREKPQLETKQNRQCLTKPAVKFTKQYMTWICISSIHISVHVLRKNFNVIKKKKHQRNAYFSHCFAFKKKKISTNSW